MLTQCFSRIWIAPPCWLSEQSTLLGQASQVTSILGKGLAALDVSIINVTVNSAHDVAKCLESIQLGC